MDQQTKINMLEKQIDSMEQEISDLKIKNELLDSENKRLKETTNIRHSIPEDVESLRIKYKDGLKELKEIKDQYYDAIYNARKTQKEYTVKFDSILKEFENMKR